MIRQGGRPESEARRVWLSPIEVAPGAPDHQQELTDTDHRQYLFIYTGGGQGELDGWVTSLEPGAVLFVPSRTVSRIVLKAGARAFWFGMADDFLISRVSPALAIPLADFMEHFHTPRKLNHWSGSAEAANRRRLWNELMLARRRLGPVGDTVVAAYVLLLLFEKGKYAGRLTEDELARLKAGELTEDNARSVPVGIVIRFRRLIEQHFAKQWRIRDYCQALAVRPVELVDACKQVLGCTPSTLIHERVLLDAKRHLTYTKASAAEIAYDLGFNDPAYFSRFFKRQTGKSPSDFRRAHHAQRNEM